MRARLSVVRGARWVGFAALSIGLMGVAGSAGRRVAHPGNGRMAGLPRLTVWAWERREDLRGLDVRTTAVAYLDRTVEVDGHGVYVVPRREGMLLPASMGLVRIAVVRVEVAAGTVLGESEADEVSRAVAGAAVQGGADPQGGIGALQVDFDARLSERGWYAGVLRRVRAEMPAGMPLSMTALASWCSYDGGWMRDLPVDEAVPMLFRMEPDRKLRGVGPDVDDGDYALREPMCMGSVGISTREDWPRDLRERRVYVFADRGWSRDGLDATVRELE